jgi:hypothetical protein
MSPALAVKNRPPDMIEAAETAVDLHRFFERALRATFRDLAFHDDPAAAYLADVLTRFARTENLYPKGIALPRLDTVVDMMLEIEAAWREASPHWAPEREVSVRRHIGDYTLFMTGIFRERVERTASSRYYIDAGKRAYRFVSEHDRAQARDGRAPYRRLAEGFEGYADALDYARRVHFFDHPHHPFFRLGLE